jgi:GNAT superfamily N-acetyltransferase
MSLNRLLLRRDINDLDLLPKPPSYATITNLSIENAPELAALMLAAYRGEVDYDGETEEEALAEVLGTINGRSGAYFTEGSFGLWQDEKLISAVMVTFFNDAPFFAFCMTAPEHKRMGNCQLLMQQSLRVLRETGWAHVTLYVTAANKPALTLYRQMGFSEGDKGAADPD